MDEEVNTRLTQERLTWLVLERLTGKLLSTDAADAREELRKRAWDSFVPGVIEREVTTLMDGAASMYACPFGDEEGGDCTDEAAHDEWGRLAGKYPALAALLLEHV